MIDLGGTSKISTTKPSAKSIKEYRIVFFSYESFETIYEHILSFQSSINFFSQKKLKLHLSIQVSINHSSPLLQTHYAHVPPELTIANFQFRKLICKWGRPQIILKQPFTFYIQEYQSESFEALFIFLLQFPAKYSHPWFPPAISHPFCVRMIIEWETIDEISTVFSAFCLCS